MSADSPLGSPTETNQPLGSNELSLHRPYGGSPMCGTRYAGAAAPIGWHDANPAYALGVHMEARRVRAPLSLRTLGHND